MLNRVLPELLFDPDVRRLASRLVDPSGGEDLSISATERRTMKRAATAFLDLAALGDAERTARSTLANPPTCVIEVPLVPLDLQDLGGLLALADLLWPVRNTETRSARSKKTPS